MDGVEANGVYRISVASFSVALESKIVTKQISEMQGYEVTGYLCIFSSIH